MNRLVTRPRTLRGEVVAPGDKAITHRAFILNAMAHGTAAVRGFGRGADCRSTLSCLKALGCDITESLDEICLHGRGLDGLSAPAGPLDAGNSGTTMRLMSGVLAALPFETQVTGDASLRSRPMERVIIPLRLMGAAIEGSGPEGVLAPLRIRGGHLEGIQYVMPVASAQLKSALLLAGINGEGETAVKEPVPSRDHTERMLKAMGGRIAKRGEWISVEPGPLSATDVSVPGDISSAAYWLVSGAVHPDADIVVRDVGVNPTRTGLIDALLEMGADLTLQDHRTVGGEPMADIRVRSSRLKGARIGGAMVPRAIDELPLIALAGALAGGTTEIRDAAELRVKESDRIAVVASELRKFGAVVEPLEDGLVVRGGGSLTGAECMSFGDHRMAMTMAVAGLVASGETVVEGAEAVDITYPEFWTDLEGLTADAAT